ncbi:squalene cyclase [Aspergillus californicus]
MADLVSQVKQTVELAIQHALVLQKPDGHWCGELKSNVTITSEYIFLRQALVLDLTTDGSAYTRYILAEQNRDGSWGMDNPAMQRARIFILGAGGVAKVRVFTRIFLATFGLFPWDAIPQLPVELILLPSFCPINIYSFSSWARGTIAPLLLICHHQPVYALPNGLNGLRTIPLLRSHARRQCITWILERQKETGDWAGIFPPMHASVYAFILEGYTLSDAPVRLALQALEDFAWEDRAGKRIQPCVSPVWDTALMAVALADVQYARERRPLDRALGWIKDRQLLNPRRGDWRVYRPGLEPGGYSFEYTNTWYPDVDDTAAVILAQVKHSPAAVSSETNPDGGWAAFDVESTKTFLIKIPFSNMDSLCDMSCSDITGRVLEAFGAMSRSAHHVSGTMDLGASFPGLREACTRAIDYLVSTQEDSGAWFGRWACNYVYGTSNVFCGLSYYVDDDPRVRGLVERAIEWVKAGQNADGGWGESLSYKGSSSERQGHVESTASQTAWAVMGLLAHLPYLPCSDLAVERGVIPLRFWDDKDYIRCLTIDFTYRFDDVLDVQKLESALGRLMRVGDWGQLGARIRRNGRRHEYHVPAGYSDSRPAFVFTTAEFDLRQNQEELMPSPAEFTPLLRHPDTPRKLEDWLSSDRPQLHIHAVLFTDATLLTITHPHTLFDALSRSISISAWITVLNNREEDVPRVLPFDTDPLDDLGKNKGYGRNYIEYSSVFGGIRFVIFCFRLLLEILWSRSEEEHPIRIPGRCLDRMHQVALDDLASRSEEMTDPAPFLSHSDLLAAWWVRTMVKALDVSPSRTVTFLNSFNTRAIVPEFLDQGDAVYIGNSISCGCSLSTASQILQDESLADIASQARQALADHRTPERIHAMAATQRASFTQTPHILGGSGVLLLSCTNYHKARCFEADFSAAVMKVGIPLEDRAHKLGRPSYINSVVHGGGYRLRNVIRVLGRDAEGDWWIVFRTRAGAWLVIHRELALLEGED